MGDIFNFGTPVKKQKPVYVGGSMEKGNPPELSTLNFPNKSESEIAIDAKFDKIYNDPGMNNDGRLPNYTKNPELDLEKTLLALKGNPADFKKEVAVVPQKPQPVTALPAEKTLPENFLNKELTQMAKNEIPVIPSVPPNGIAPIGSSTMNCKFLNSKNCHPDYPHFSGASINFPEGSKMKCDSIGNEKSAKAICTISAGKITGVYLLDGGDGHGNSPKVEAIGGGGKNSKLKAIVSDGKITDIKIINPGEGFHETPVIKIESPNMSNGCYLCCK